MRLYELWPLIDPLIAIYSLPGLPAFRSASATTVTACAMLAMTISLFSNATPKNIQVAASKARSLARVPKQRQSPYPR